MNKGKVLVAGLSLSAAGFIGLVGHENYVENAMIPTKNDRPTVGFGSTFHEDGTPVKLGDKTTPVKALVTAKAHIDREEAIFRKSLDGARLSQAEFDLYMDWVYQYGTGAWSNSSMRRLVLQDKHSEACDALLEYRYLTSSVPTAGWEFKNGRYRYDCSQTVNGQRNRVCWGVWTRQQERHDKCMAAQ